MNSVFALDSLQSALASFAIGDDLSRTLCSLSYSVLSLPCFIPFTGHRDYPIVYVVLASMYLDTKQACAFELPAVDMLVQVDRILTGENIMDGRTLGAFGDSLCFCHG